MTRNTFSQVLRSAQIDPKKEYERLYAMFYEQSIPDGNGVLMSLYSCCAANFFNFPFRKTCISLADFDDSFRFHFEKFPGNCDIDYLVRFCEYSYNLAFANQQYLSHIFMIAMNQANQLYLTQIKTVIEAIGYMENTKNGLTDFVPKDQAAISVAEILDPALSYKVIEYNHHSMKGDLERKKATLLCLADILEPQRQRLSTINSTLEDNVFFLFNNVNLRHNNADSEGKKYIPFVAGLKENEIEQWYDDTYQMCLLAFLELDNVERKTRIKQLKQDVQSR